MTSAQFLIECPEFVGIDVTYLAAALAATALQIDPVVWGLKADQGVKYLCAHKLALSPFGQNARMVDAKGTTTYWVHYKQLRNEVASGYRTT